MKKVVDFYIIGVHNVVMQRINHHLTEQQIESLRKLSVQSGLSVAEIIRRIIDEHFKIASKKGVGSVR